ncbi:MAG: GTP-binding protein [Gammaproteobacteria bacterium]|nr:GTP-binding protein [Gammaproteobacteria bacterium]
MTAQTLEAESITRATPIPSWVIAGPLGSGKTTLIARWLAEKPERDNWVVLLNEYTDAGIDALTVAAAAKGAFDVRLVPGGCLCCSGEADFRRNLLDLIERVRPVGILVEPSGIGHPGSIVEELLAHEAAGTITLCGVIGLIDPSHLESSDETVIAVREIADALVLAKVDLANNVQKNKFIELADGLFPAKSWVGEVEQGALPSEAFRAIEQGRSVRQHSPLLKRPSSHAAEHAQALEHAYSSEHAHVSPDGQLRREFHHLGRHGARWIFPRATSFVEMRFLTLLSSDLSLVDPALARPERLKAVIRVDEDTWLLLQLVQGQLSMQPTAWRRDNRIEVQLPPGVKWEADAWDRLWARCLRSTSSVP